MKILIIDADADGLNFALRSMEYGHSVRLWNPREPDGSPCPVGVGLVEKPADWRPSMDWADLILVTSNAKYGGDLEPYFQKGYPIIGANKAGAAWELDREVGQKVLEEAGTPILNFEVFSDYDKAAEFVKKSPRKWVSKPWGGTADKALSYVPPDGFEKNALIFKLMHWKKQGLKGQFMLQERIEGIEMGVSGWFGPGGWTQWIEEDWEFKRLMPGNLGPNTGEQGTVIRFVKRSKLFNEMCKPLTEALHKTGYVGCVNVNCMMDAEGQMWPMEFTMRPGWPAYNIMMALIEGDPAGWQADLLVGKDTLKMKKEIAVGVVVSHWRYPFCRTTEPEARGYPLYGINHANQDSLHYSCIMQGGKEVSYGPVTAGTYIMVVTGLSDTVSVAAKKAVTTARQIKMPTDRGFRIDIGERLKKELPMLQEFGYASGMEY